ncbi:hypothetical protein [Streptomyces sp. NRRL WC-3742]|uniref:hypothetical protein n=1 Tax=Streptomyces sp. NRRL WC-3742 TaxID=1463934 RepID=UPI000690431F|nr:hypothetical protein [Streptomyces sp. NRRL WC-3742]
MRTRLLAATLTAFAAVSLAACSSSGSGSGSSAAGSPTTTAATANGTAASAAPTADATGTAPASTPADGASPGAPAPAKPAPPTDAGLPGKPDADLTAKLVAALNAIDPAIVDGKPGQAVERARSQCQAIFQFPKDKQKLAELADQRFTSPQHPQGLGPETAAKINDALRSTLCPPSR